MPAALEIGLVVLDWAGTTVDHGSFAPVAAFVDAFARQSVAVTSAEARGPMGLHKKDHIREILRMPAVAERWRQKHRRDWTEDDVERLYRTFIPLQMEVIDRHAELVPGLLDSVAALRRAGIRIGATTGYFQDAADRVVTAARRQGYEPDCPLNPDSVRAGRPAPWMIFRIMEALDVCPPARVIKVGDTVPDIEEGRSAGAWSVGVVRTGSDVGCTAEEVAALPAAEREVRFAAARRKLLDAGAHAVIDSVANVPALVGEINGRLRRGERP